jgi:hypothetical protein
MTNLRTQGIDVLFTSILFISIYMYIYYLWIFWSLKAHVFLKELNKWLLINFKTTS